MNSFLNGYQLVSNAMTRLLFGPNEAPNSTSSLEWLSACNSDTALAVLLFVMWWWSSTRVTCIRVAGFLFRNPLQARESPNFLSCWYIYEIMNVPMSNLRQLDEIRVSIQKIVFFCFFFFFLFFNKKNFFLLFSMRIWSLDEIEGTVAFFYDHCSALCGPLRIKSSSLIFPVVLVFVLCYNTFGGLGCRCCHLRRFYTPSVTRVRWT